MLLPTLPTLYIKLDLYLIITSAGYTNYMLARHEAIMLQKLSIMLVSSAQKITYYAFENCPLCRIRLFSLMFKLQIVLNSLSGCYIRVFHFNVTALLE